MQHALSTALREVHSIDRSSLLGILLRLRTEKPFLKIREILADEHLLLFEGEAENERRAEKLLEEIRHYVNPNYESHDIDVDGYRILRDTHDAGVTEYED